MSKMSRLEVTFPEKMRENIQHRVKEGLYSSENEFVRSAVRDKIQEERQIEVEA